MFGLAQFTGITAQEVGSWTFDLIKDLAKGFIEKQIEQRTGVVL
jgi:hypothetical protein